MEKMEEKNLTIIKKIELKTNIIYNKIKSNSTTILIFLFILVLFLFMQSVIYIYFDDYGNASLSYSNQTDTVVGTDFNIHQLLEWATNIYYNWGGRILYAVCFLNPLLKINFSLYMIIQAFVLTGIVYLIYKISTYYTDNKKNVWVIPIVIFILYNLIDLVYLKQGIYWASASVLYIWPLLPLFTYMFYYIKLCDKIRNNKKVKYKLILPILFILNFFATFSQEQIGIALIAFEMFYIILHHIKQIKKFLLIDLTNLFVSITSYLFLFCAPGNWKRMDTNREFASLSFFGKIINKFPGIISCIFSGKMNIYILILALLLIYMSIKLIMEYINNNKKCLFFIIPIIVSILEIFIICIVNKWYNSYVMGITSTIWLIDMLMVFLFYFKKKEKIEFCSIIISAACSVFCLLISPVLPERVFLPFIFYLMIIIVTILNDILNDSKYIVKLISVGFIIYLGIISTINYCKIYDGYRNNYSIMKLDDKILSSYDKNKNEKNIYLYKVEDVRYGAEFQYIKPSMEYWMKEYYDIPQNVKFEWIDIYEGVRKQ